MWFKNTNLESMTPIVFIEFSSRYIPFNNEKFKKKVFLYISLHNLLTPIHIKIFVLKPTNIFIQKTTSLSEQNKEDIPRHKINMVMDNLHISIEDQKYKSILYIIDLLKWNSQSGEHFESRPGYNIRPYVTIILYVL